MEAVGAWPGRQPDEEQELLGEPLELLLRVGAAAFRSAICGQRGVSQGSNEMKAD